MARGSEVPKGRTISTSPRVGTVLPSEAHSGSKARKRSVKVSIDRKVFLIDDIQPSGLNALIVTAARGAAESLTTGTAEFTVRITRGSLSISDVRTHPTESAPAPSDATGSPDLMTTRSPEDEEALAAARERGLRLTAEILHRPEMLSGQEFGKLLSLSRVAVNDRRQKHEFLGLEGTKRGFRYPSWQIRDDGKPFPELPRLFELLGDSPWGIYRFLVQPHAELDDRSALEDLRQGRSEAVLEVAENIGRGDFA